VNLTVANLDAIYLQALCCWREARGEAPETQRAQIWSVLNRCAVAAWWNHNIANDPVEVILMPEQYSAFNVGDPNATKFPHSSDAVFKEIKLLVLSPGDDPTGGATHYYSGDVVPDWAAAMQHTVDIGNLRFFK
jgi:hypothetical protein